MKKIKFAIISTFIIIYITASFAFAAEVKNTSPAATRNPVNLTPAATPAQLKQPLPVPAATTVPVKQPLTGAAANATSVLAPAAAQNQPQPLTTSPIDNYNYNPLGKPDPFRPFVTVDVAVAKKQVLKKAEVSMFPLQRADAEKYRIVGIAGDKDHRVAICEDTAKKFYTLHKGTHIGLYNGKVIEIMADRVIIEEYETKKPRRVILKLRKN
ncbi:MAG: pilus assembly protein PilP [Smithella sp.]